MLECETSIIIETTDLRVIPNDFLQSVLQYHNLTLLCTKKFLVADTELERLLLDLEACKKAKKMVSHTEVLLYQKN